MTSFFPFTPSNIAAPTFMPTLDGNPHTIQVFWLLFGQRYILNCYDLSGNRIFTRALIESEAGIGIDNLSWSVLSGLVTVTTEIPHGYPIGSMKKLTIAGCVPDTYNGAYQVFVNGPSSFTYPLPVDPGIASVFGEASFLMNMAAGYFDSTLIFRNGQFEVSP